MICPIVDVSDNTNCWPATIRSSLCADAAEAFVSNSRSAQVEVSDRAVEKVNTVNDAGIGIWVLKDQKMVFGSSNDLARDSVDRLVSDRAQKVTYHTPDEFNVIPGIDEYQDRWCISSPRVHPDVVL